MAQLLNVKNLKKYFRHGEKELKILKSVSIKVQEGEMLGVVGASGAGKSTLLHLVGGLDSPTEGSILFKGEDITKFNSNQLASYRAKEIGFVFQFHHLLPAFNAVENVMIPALIQRESREKAIKLAKDALELVGLKDRMTHKPGQLSGGEQQRVAIARAIVMEPSLLLADEPTGNLDSKTSGKINDLLFDLNKKLDMTMLVVTHNIKLASLFARKVTMADGEIRGDESRE